MNQMHSFESAFARDLQLRIRGVVQERALAMAQGGSLVETSPEATALKYSADVAYIRALENVLEWCVDVEDDLTGRTAARAKQQKQQKDMIA